MITLLIIVIYLVIGMFIGRKIYRWQDSKHHLHRYWGGSRWDGKRSPKPTGAGFIVLGYAIIWPFLTLISFSVWVLPKMGKIPERIGYWVGAGY